MWRGTSAAALRRLLLLQLAAAAAALSTGAVEVRFALNVSLGSVGSPAGFVPAGAPDLVGEVSLLLWPSCDAAACSTVIEVTIEGLRARSDDAAGFAQSKVPTDVAAQFSTPLLAVLDPSTGVVTSILTPVVDIGDGAAGDASDDAVARTKRGVLAALQAVVPTELFSTVAELAASFNASAAASVWMDGYGGGAVMQGSGAPTLDADLEALLAGRRRLAWLADEVDHSGECRRRAARFVRRASRVCVRARLCASSGRRGAGLGGTIPIASRSLQDDGVLRPSSTVEAHDISRLPRPPRLFLRRLLPCRVHRGAAAAVSRHGRC
jgi:hypothetical protein